jgi:transposase
MVSMQPRPWPLVPEQTAVVARAAFPKGSLPIRVRDELGEVFADVQFAAAFGVRGAPAESPGVLVLVTALQYAEGLTDRQAADMVRRAIDWKYCLGLELGDPGFDFTVLSKFRARVVEHGLEERALDLLLEALKEKGLVKAGGKQRTDSTHVISAVRDLNRLELAGESVRSCVEALAVAAPSWLTDVIDVPGWNHRYGARVDTWRLPTSETKRKEMAVVYGTDALALLRAIHAPAAPAWLRELPAVQVLRTVLLQNYIVTAGRQGREVVKRREADTDGLPPARVRITSP